jgi:hypothetical protein
MRSHELHVVIDDAMEVFWGRKSMNDSVLPIFMAAPREKQEDRQILFLYSNRRHRSML